MAFCSKFKMNEYLCVCKLAKQKTTTDLCHISSNLLAQIDIYLADITCTQVQTDLGMTIIIVYSGEQS